MHQDLPRMGGTPVEATTTALHEHNAMERTRTNGANSESSSEQTSAMTKKKRNYRAAITVTSLCLLMSFPDDGCDALSSIPTMSSKSFAGVGTPSFTTKPTTLADSLSFRTASSSQSSQEPLVRAQEETSLSWTDELLTDFEDDVEEFQELQFAKGSEIVSEDLQEKIDRAAIVPDLFLDAYVEDASLIEKVAMSSIPQQLPKPAVQALSARQRRTSKKNNAKNGRMTKNRVARSGLNEAKERITPEDEIRLGKSIQQGVALHKVKSDFESKHGREITRQEWIEQAGLASAKELRRRVSEYRQSKQELVASNIGLVHAVVRSTPAGSTALSYEERVQEGSLGLVRAAELFDPSRGIRFSTYATIWIKGTLSNSHAKETITLPAREKTKWNKIRNAHEELQQELQREPTPPEIGERVGMTEREVVSTSKRMTQARSVLSLDYEYTQHSRGGGDSGADASLWRDKSLMADADLAERNHLQADVVAALAKNLDAREERLMRLRYGLSDGNPRTIAECAEAMGISKTRVQQLAQSCLKKLRDAADADSLQEYLLTIA